MAAFEKRRVNTVSIELLRGRITQKNAPVLLPTIIRDTYGIAVEELYGVSLNGNFRIFVKLLSAPVYERLVDSYEDVCVNVNSEIRVRLTDVSGQYTRLKLRNVPSEGDEADCRVFTKSGVIHAAQPGTRIIYERNFLLQMRNSPLARTPPKNLPVIPGVTTKDDAVVHRENGTIAEEPEKTEHAEGDQFEMDL